MSGGHFDWKNYGIGEFMGGEWRDAELNELFDDLFVKSIGSDREDGGLAGTLDYYLAGDYGEDTYRDEVSKFKEKWFGQSRAERLKGIVDKELGRVRDEMYATIDFGERANGR